MLCYLKAYITAPIIKFIYRPFNVITQKRFQFHPGQKGKGKSLNGHQMYQYMIKGKDVSLDGGLTIGPVTENARISVSGVRATNIVSK